METETDNPENPTESGQSGQICTFDFDPQALWQDQYHGNRRIAHLSGQSGLSAAEGVISLTFATWVKEKQNES